MNMFLELQTPKRKKEQWEKKIEERRRGLPEGTDL